MAFRFEIEKLQEFVRAAPLGIKGAKKGQHFIYVKFVSKLRVLKLNANSFPQRVISILAPAQTKESNRAGSRGVKALQHFNRRSLTGTVGPQEPKASARSDLEVNARNSTLLAIVLDQGGADDGRVGHGGPTLAFFVMELPTTVDVTAFFPNRHVDVGELGLCRRMTWVVPTFVHVAFGAPAPNAAI